MKRLTLLFVLLSSQVFGQDKDLIIPFEGDSIECTVSKTNDQNIYYKSGGGSTKTMPLSKVSEYYLNGVKTETVAKQKSDVIDQEMPVDKETGRITYEEVVEVSGRTKDQLYSTAREWYVDRYNSAEAVLQMEDKESGKLIGKAHAEVRGGIGNTIVTWKLKYTIKVLIKAGRYKVNITDMSYEGRVGTATNIEPILKKENLYKKNGKPNKALMLAKSDTIESIEALLADLKATMLKSKESDEDDW